MTDCGKKGESLVIPMEKRLYKRIPAELSFHCFNIEHYGVVTDLSVNGMFIQSKKISFPLETQFEISIPFQEEVLRLPVKVNRVTRSNGYYDGLGVTLLTESQNYIKLINRLGSEVKNRE